MSELWTNAGLTTVNALFGEARDKWPDRIYLDFSGRTFTYREADEQSARLATPRRIVVSRSWLDDS